MRRPVLRAKAARRQRLLMVAGLLIILLICIPYALVSRAPKVGGADEDHRPTSQQPQAQQLAPTNGPAPTVVAVERATPNAPLSSSPPTAQSPTRQEEPLPTAAPPKKRRINLNTEWGRHQEKQEKILAARWSRPDRIQPGKLHPKFPQGDPIPTPYQLDMSDFSTKQHRVVKGIEHAFRSYKAYAWGHDELCPLQKGFVDWSQGPNSGIGLTAIESLDTLWLAGLYEHFFEVIDYLKTEHTFHKPLEVGLFETTIRMLGGLLSAYELSGEPILLEKAKDIGDRLFNCVEGRPIPFASVVLDTGHVSNPGWLGMQQSLAEVTTIQLEFLKLSQYTGIAKYAEETRRVEKTILSHLPDSGLMPMYISMHDGSPISGTVTLGARGDSFYEYLAKLWVLTNRTEDWIREAYEKVSNAIVTKLMVQIDEGHALIAESSSHLNPHLELKMDHLVCFVVGMLQLGKHGATATRDDEAAADIARTCHNMYSMNPTGLGVEIVRFSDGGKHMYPSPGAAHYIMRPEVVEALFYQARFHPEQYEEWTDKVWRIYENMEKHLKVEHGWVGLVDATTLNSGYDNKMQSFFVAETLKYCFLSAASKEVGMRQLPLDEWVFNTEAHPLRVTHGTRFA